MISNSKYVEILAKELIQKHCPDYKFEWFTKKKTIGYCNWKTKIINLSISFVEYNLDKPEEIIDTIIHEISHALTPRDGHGKKWKAKCIELGCTPKRVCQVKLNKPKGKYTLMCKTCGYTNEYYRKLKNIKSCPRCDNKFNPKYILEIA